MSSYYIGDDEMPVMIYAKNAFLDKKVWNFYALAVRIVMNGIKVLV
jgi:hypothetical protein